MKPLKMWLSAAALAAAFALSGPAMADNADAGAIRHLMMAQFDRPDARLTVEPVTVHGSIAVAGWAQGDMGGRALLRRHGDQWRLVLCSGDALKQAASLRQFGLTAEEADMMAKAVVGGGAALAPAVGRKSPALEGVMRRKEEGNPPPLKGHTSGHRG